MSKLIMLRNLRLTLYDFLAVMVKVLLDSFGRKSKLLYVVNFFMFTCTCDILPQLVATVRLTLT